MMEVITEGVFGGTETENDTGINTEGIGEVRERNGDCTENIKNVNGMPCEVQADFGSFES